jgi:hypothetical protein
MHYLSKQQGAWILKAPKHSLGKNRKQEVQSAQIFIQEQQRWWHLHFLFANFYLSLNYAWVLSKSKIIAF